MTAPSGSKTVELSKIGAKWDLIQPVAWPADSFDARSLVESFANLRTHGKVDLKAENLSATGLNKPRYLVEMTDKDGKTIKLTIGNRTELGNNLYVSTDDGKSGELVSAGTLGDKLDKGTDKLADSLRDKQIVRVTSSDVKQIKVTRPGQPPLVLNKVADDWKMVSPQVEDAESTEVSDLLSTITNLRADQFVDQSSPEVSRARFDTPRVTVWLNTAAPTTQPATGPSVALAGVTITIGEPTNVEMDKAYVKVSDPAIIAQASLTQSALDKIAKASPLSLRDRRVVNIDPAKVSEVSLRIDRPATTQPTTKPAEQVDFQITRRKEKLILGPVFPGAPATREAAPATEPAVPSTLPATSPATRPSAGSGRIRALSPFLALAGEISASAPAATQPETRPATEPAVTPATLPATEPATAPSPTAPSPHAAAPAVVPPAPPPSKWVLQGGANADDDQVKELLDALHPLKVEKYLESAPTTQPTANYVLTVKTIGAGGADTASYELQITDPGGESKLIGRYNDLTFELDRSLLKKLDGDFKTRARRNPPPRHRPASPAGRAASPEGSTPAGDRQQSMEAFGCRALHWSNWDLQAWAPARAAPLLRGARASPRILVLSASSGSGHVRAAEAVQLALQAACPDALVADFDAMSFSNAAFRRVYSAGYFDLVDKAPHLLGYLYDRSDRPSSGSILDRIRVGLQRLNLQRLVELIVTGHWDLAVSTHFLPAEIIASLRRAGRINFPQATVTTDFDTHHMWCNDPCDLFFAASDEAAINLESCGVRREDIRVTGIPVHPLFSESKGMG